MDYKEKYDKALERARKYKNYGYITINYALNNIFPELNESEDERIRKALITFFQRFPYDRKRLFSLEMQNKLAQ